MNIKLKKIFPSKGLQLLQLFRLIFTCTMQWYIALQHHLYICIIRISELTHHTSPFFFSFDCFQKLKQQKTSQHYSDCSSEKTVMEKLKRVKTHLISKAANQYNVNVLFQQIELKTSEYKCTFSPFQQSFLLYTRLQTRVMNAGIQQHIIHLGVMHIFTSPQGIIITAFCKHSWNMLFPYMVTLSINLLTHSVLFKGS